MSTQDTAENGNAVAIIGMKGRFPGARDLDQFWTNLREGVESISRFSPEDLRRAGMDAALLKVPGFVPAGAVLDQIGMFDANFFGFSARDAEMMDPQQRLFLECAYECLEDAGYDSESYRGAIGVFAGCDWSTYLAGIYSVFDKLGYVDGMSLAVGNDKDHLTTHVSYKLNLRGPSVAVQTACSTSLVAVCMATHSLQARQCDMALAGGVAVSIPQRKGYFYQPGGIVSPDGHCRAFDAEGQGTVIGSGVGIVALKRLADAVTDGDHIYAVVKGAALNNDGSAKVGYTAPSIEGQAQVIAMAQAAAGVDPETITYVEAHGTATALGDPIEVTALTHAFRQRTSRKGFCAIGSLKSNVGHMSSAAGVGALIKTVLCLQRGELPPTLFFKRGNPQIDFANSPFYVNDTLRPWTTNGHPRRAAVSSFGIGGTNAHVVLEEAPAAEPSGPSRALQFLTISAKTANALERATDDLAAALEHDPSLNLADVAYTLQTGRRAFNPRRVLVCEGDVAEAARALRARDASRLLTETEARERPIVFLFPGQGTQYVNMGQQLYRTEPTFRACVDQCSELLQPHLQLDLRDLLYPASNEADRSEQLKQTAMTQPALFTIQYALAQLWMEWGASPQAMIGHSIGEYTAACLAQVLRLEDALAVVALRGSLMGQMRAGAMLAVPLGEAEVQPLLGSGVSLAAVNGPSQSVLSGPTPLISTLARQLDASGTRATLLQTSHAFHSAMMEPILKPFLDRMQSVALKAPKIPFISCVTGTWITPDQAVSPAYWAKQLRQTVRFGNGVQALARLGDLIAIEVGPGRTLSTLAQLQPSAGRQRLFLPSLQAAHEPQNDMSVALTSLAKLWLAGIPVSWSGFSRHERRRRVSLPTYPFEREHYWLGPSEQADTAPAVSPVATSRDVADWFYVPNWSASKLSGSHASASVPAGVRWLILGPDDVLHRQLRDRLVSRDQEVTTVAFGASFQRTGPAAYTVDPGCRDDYETLLKDLRGEGRIPAKIVHLGAVASHEATDPAVEFASCQEFGCYSLLLLAQALERQNITQSVDVGVVSTGLQTILGDEPLTPAKATLLGPCKVIPQEYGNLTVRSIDLLAEEIDGAGGERLLDNLISELTVEPFEAAVAYRKARRWVQRFDALPLAATESPLRLRDRGVYLITGGLGSIGLALAARLARSVRARLVLVGRSALPPRDEWERRIAADPQDATSTKIRALLDIEGLGGEVLVLQADVSSREQMRRVLERVEGKFGELHGIIHGAGNTTAQAFFPINQTDETAGLAHFPPKAHGAIVLDELTAGRRLDFCLMLSSLSAVLGGLGLAVYAGANAYLDAFAARKNPSSEFPWISVNWDAWHFPEGAESTPSGTWADAIRPDEGADAFMRILHHAPRQVVVSTSNLQDRLDKWVALKSLREGNRAPAAGRSLHARPPLGTQLVSPRTSTEERVADVWQQLLGVGPIGVLDKFFELGGHSLLAIQVISRLREAFGIELPVQRLFEAPTVAQLAEAIDRELSAPAAEPEAEVDSDRMAEMLSLVEGLSDAEVAALLAEEANG